MKTTPQFDERSKAINALRDNSRFHEKSLSYVKELGELGQQYTWDWLGLPIIQVPNDIVQLQQLIFLTKPDLIIETGIARGGSLAFSASMLCLLDIMEGLDPRTSSRKVLGLDIDIRPHNLQALKDHPLFYKLELIEGSSVDQKVVGQVRNYASRFDNILVCLDSNHTHEHVIGELEAYAYLTSLNSYCIVFDTLIEYLPSSSFSDRPWDVGNNPKTAVDKWILEHPEFIIDKEIDDKLHMSVATGGYLRRIS